MEDATAPHPDHTGISSGNAPPDLPMESQDAIAQDAIDTQSEAENEEDLRSIIEALIFASDEPIAFRLLKDVIVGPDAGDEISAADSDGAAGAASDGEATGGNALDGDGTRLLATAETAPGRQGRRKNAARFTLNLVKRCVDALNTEYRSTGRSFRITEVAGGFAFQTVHDYGIYVGRLHADKARRRLSQSALETLAIIAFKQPISKPAIEAIRGVNADFVLKSLLERNLVTIVGRDSTVGRPLLYGTTKTFLKHFGLKNLDDLPRPREIQELLEEDAALESLSVEDIDRRKHAELHHHSPEDEHLFDTVEGAAGDGDETTDEAISGVAGIPGDTVNDESGIPDDIVNDASDTPDEASSNDHAAENTEDVADR